MVSMSDFPADVVAAVLRHMNDDHNDDSLLIMRAFVNPHAVKALMTKLDGERGYWSFWTAEDANPEEVAIAWPSGSISERAEIRREIVTLYEQACDQLGLEQRPH